MHARTRVGTPFGINPAAVLDAIERSISQIDNASYPPFNIVQGEENSYAIEMAVAGFTEEQISISVEKRELVIEAKPLAEDERTFLHKGIAQRAFRRVFRLAEYVEVRDAGMKNGLLTITLELVVPEEAKPREISITRN